MIFSLCTVIAQSMLGIQPLIIQLVFLSPGTPQIASMRVVSVYCPEFWMVFQRLTLGCLISQLILTFTPTFDSGVFNFSTDSHLYLCEMKYSQLHKKLGTLSEFPE